MNYTTKCNGVEIMSYEAYSIEQAITYHLQYTQLAMTRATLEGRLNFPDGQLADMKHNHISLHDEHDRMIFTNNEFLSTFVNQITDDKWKGLQAGEHKPSDAPSVYFDIDGTLAKWNVNAAMEEVFDIQNHYFRKVEPEKFVIDLAYKLYLDGMDVCIISAAEKDTIPDKYEWLKENLPFIEDENIFFSPIGADKTQFIKSNADISVLIDDYNPNLQAWREAGGHAVKMLNGINSHHSGFSEISFESLKKRQRDLHEAEKNPDIPEEHLEKAKESLADSAFRAIGMVAGEIEKTIGFDPDDEKHYQFDDKE